MNATCRTALSVFALACLGATPSAASADWICIKNDTRLALVIRDVPDSRTQTRAKVVKLLPGEVYREYRSAAGEKKVEVFDARSPAKPLWVGKLKWSATGEAAVQVVPADEAVRLKAVPPTDPKAAVVHVAAELPKR